MDGIVVSGQNWWTRFLRRHPRLDAALIAATVVLFVLLLFWLLFYTPPEFSAAVSRSEGLDPSRRAAGSPTFAVTLRARNRDVWRHCFKPGGNGSAVVAYAGVPLAGADLPGFCVPAMSVATVRFVARGGGLGIPDVLYESMEAQRGGRRERVALTLRVRLEEDFVVPHNLPKPPMLLWCEAMLDGHPANAPCAAFGMAKG